MGNTPFYKTEAKYNALQKEWDDVRKLQKVSPDFVMSPNKLVALKRLLPYTSAFLPISQPEFIKWKADLEKQINAEIKDVTHSEPIALLNRIQKTERTLQIQKSNKQANEFLEREAELSAPHK